MDFERFLRFLRALERENVNYVLVGGVALNLHGIVRATEEGLPFDPSIEPMQWRYKKNFIYRTMRMPIQKFSDLDEARRALWVQPGAPDLVLRIRRLWAFSARLAPRQIPRGVRKFRSIEEANAARDQWVECRVRTLRAKRAASAHHHHTAALC